VGRPVWARADWYCQSSRLEERTDSRAGPGRGQPARQRANFKGYVAGWGRCHKYMENHVLVALPRGSVPACQGVSGAPATAAQSAPRHLLGRCREPSGTGPGWLAGPTCCSSLQGADKRALVLEPVGNWRGAASSPRCGRGVANSLVAARLSLPGPYAAQRRDIATSPPSRGPHRPRAGPQRTTGPLDQRFARWVLPEERPGGTDRGEYVAQVFAWRYVTCPGGLLASHSHPLLIRTRFPTRHASAGRF